MRRTTAVVLLIVVLLAGGRTRAWGTQGHHIVAMIAATRLTDNVRTAVKTILGDEDFVAASTWADQVRADRPETANWHFVDIQVGDPTYNAARDCPATPKGDCVIAAIARSREAVTNAALTPEARREALKFIIHFVGDMHQPLHSTDNHDRGGNDVKVNGDAGRATNLHSIWDSGVIQKRGLDEATYARLLLDGLTTHPVPAADAVVDVVKWAEGVHKVGVDVVYTFPEFAPGAPPTAVITLDDAYYTRALPIVDRQLQVAGVRLAALLNATLGR